VEMQRASTDDMTCRKAFPKDAAAAGVAAAAAGAGAAMYQRDTCGLVASN